MSQDEDEKTNKPRRAAVLAQARVLESSARYVREIELTHAFHNVLKITTPSTKTLKDKRHQTLPIFCKHTHSIVARACRNWVAPEVQQLIYDGARHVMVASTVTTASSVDNQRARSIIEVMEILKENPPPLATLEDSDKKSDSEPHPSTLWLECLKKTKDVCTSCNQLYDASICTRWLKSTDPPNKVSDFALFRSDEPEDQEEPSTRSFIVMGIGRATASVVDGICITPQPNKTILLVRLGLLEFQTCDSVSIAPRFLLSERATLAATIAKTKRLLESSPWSSGDWKRILDGNWPLEM